MNTLKEDTMNCINELNQEWIKAFKKGEKEGGIDLSEIMGRYSEITKKLDKHFIDAKIRVKEQKKKGIFG